MGENKRQKKEIIKAALFAVFILFIFFCTAKTPLSAQPYGRDALEELSAANILGFAKSCAADGDFYRAAAELDRLRGYYPDYLDKNIFSASKFYYFFKGAQYSALLTEYKLYENPALPLTIFASDSLLMSGDFLAMRGLLESNYADNIGASFNEMFFKRRLLAGLITYDDDALASLENLYSSEYSVYKELIDSVKMTLSYRKKPALAAILVIVPGAGYAYAGDFKTGIIAFAVVGLSGILSYTAYTNGNKLPAFFIGTAGTLFYGGSIIGGYLSSIKFNKALRQDAAETCSYRMSLGEDREVLYREYGIGK